MNDFAHAPVIRFNTISPVHHVDGPPEFCAFDCWGKSWSATYLRDELNRPICAKCAARSDRVQHMPWFVLLDVNGELQ